MSKSYVQQLEERIEQMKADGLTDIHITPNGEWNPKDEEEVAKSILEFMDAPKTLFWDSTDGFANEGDSFD